MLLFLIACATTHPVEPTTAASGLPAIGPCEQLMARTLGECHSAWEGRPLPTTAPRFNPLTLPEQCRLFPERHAELTACNAEPECEGFVTCLQTTSDRDWSAEDSAGLCDAVAWRMNSSCVEEVFSEVEAPYSPRGLATRSALHGLHARCESEPDIHAALGNCAWRSCEELGECLVDIVAPALSELPIELEMLAAALPEGMERPRSSSATPVPLAPYLVVSPSEIVLDGAKILRLEGGEIPDEVLRGFLISPLYDHLVEKGEIERALAVRMGRPVRTTLAMDLDARTPMLVVLKLAYTAGQARYDDLRLVVEDEGGAAHSLALTLPEIGPPGEPERPRPPALAVGVDEITLVTGPGESRAFPKTVLDSELSPALAQARPSSGELVIVVDDSLDVQDLVRVADIARDEGYTRLVLARMAP